MTRSRRRSIMVTAAWGMRGLPVGYVARVLGVSERSVERYWRFTMAGSSLPPVPEVYLDKADPRALECIAHNIAGWAPDAQAALEVAEALDVPRSAFADALSAIRVTRYAAPAAELFTVLHVVARGYSEERFSWTACGRVMFPEQLWQFIEAADGDPVCSACRGRANGYVQETLL